jgi:hypothetical protein
MEVGIDYAGANKRHFRTKSFKRLKMESMIVDGLKCYDDGELVIATVTLDMMNALGATEQDMEDISAFIGQIEGVKTAVTLRELHPGECKLSVRTGSDLNASDICALLGGGAGSWFSQRFDGKALRRWAIFATVGVALLTLGYAPLLGWLHTGLVGVSLPVRCLTAAGLLLPLGFLLGTPFPSGMRLFSAGRAAQVPLVWGLNGVASVVGSLGAAMGAKLYGFNTILIAGAMVYLFATLLLTAQRPK